MDKKKWIDDIMQSLEGSERALPSDELFNKIEQRIAGTEARVIPLNRIRTVAAAAAVLLFLNIYAVSEYANAEVSGNTGIAVEDDTYNLLSNYEIYTE